MYRSYRLLLVVLICLSMTSFGLSKNAIAATPSIAATPDSLKPGDTVRLTVAGFPADAEVRVRLDGRTLTTGRTNGRGRLVTRLPLPDVASGGRELVAKSGRVTATSLITVEPGMFVENRRLTAGSSFTARIAGFGVEERVSFVLVRGDSVVRLPSTVTGSRGGREKTLTLPADLPTGTFTLEARGRSGLTAAVRLAVTALPVEPSATSAPSLTPEVSPSASPESTPPSSPEPTSTATSSPTATSTATIVPSSTPTPRATSTATPPPTAAPRPSATPTSTPPGDLSIWVDPVNGRDSNSGSSRGQAVRTLAEAWNRIPAGRNLTSAYRLRLVAGSYPAIGMPNYMEQRYGTGANPITIEAADGPGTAVVNGNMNIYDVRYLTIRDLVLRNSGDVVHCELCRHFTITGSTLDGQGAAHETLKVNQSQYVDILNSDLSGTYENAIDFVAVQHGRIIGNRLHDAEDWCIYLKGGSADFWIEGNEIFNCGTGGFSAGQGTGFQFMVQPWITYEAEDITFIRNSIHDTDGAGIGVNGGKNILLAENVMTRVGARSHVIEVGFGGRSCDGQPGDDGRQRCAEYLAAGGWGTTVVDNGDNYVRIPNKNVTIRDNVVDNPAGYRSQWQHFFIAGPYGGASQAGSNAPNPAMADDGLVITGNVINNGDGSMPLGVGEGTGCQPENPTCNESQLYADNDINGR